MMEADNRPYKNPRPPGFWYERLLAFIWYDCLLLVYIGVVALIKEFSTSPPVLNIEKMDKRTGQVAVITGGPRGLALGLIKRLAQLDYTIIMGVRNVEDSKRRLSKFSRANPKMDLSKVKFSTMDLASLRSIRKFADWVVREVPRIDLLLCNAAIMNAPYELTEDRLESQFQMNYLANFVLTELLLQKLKKTSLSKDSPCHIVYTSSMVYSYGTPLFDEIKKCKVYTPYKFYYASKLYEVTAMLDLDKRMEQEGANIHSYCVHPGLVPTDLWYSAGGGIARIISASLRFIFRTLDNAADTILWPVFSQEHSNRGGLYLESGSSIPISAQAHDQDNQAKLLRISKTLSGIS